MSYDDGSCTQHTQWLHTQTFWFTFIFIIFTNWYSFPFVQLIVDQCLQNHDKTDSLPLLYYLGLFSRLNINRFVFGIYKFIIGRSWALRYEGESGEGGPRGRSSKVVWKTLQCWSPRDGSVLCTSRLWMSENCPGWHISQLSLVLPLGFRSRGPGVQAKYLLMIWFSVPVL